MGLQTDLELWTLIQDYPLSVDGFCQSVQPTPVESPHLIEFNGELAEHLGLQSQNIPADQIASFFGGNTASKTCDTRALAYAGHQFGHFVPLLGDGRAIMLGQYKNDRDSLLDVQLKGAGPTPFSRGGDGRCPLGPALREYLVSEAIFAMGIPTTRCLAVIATNETVFRNRPLPGAVVTRVANSHLRIGTFQFYASRGQWDDVRTLADYAISRHHPDLCDEDLKYNSLLKRVIRCQAKLVSQWMSVGFIHGVMNTDNMSIAGETIDYGPCAFLDEYNFSKVFSSIDQQGRYAYGNQPTIAQWNLTRFAECLLPLMSPQEEQAIAMAQELLDEFSTVFSSDANAVFAQKIGLMSASQRAEKMVANLLGEMQEHALDFTNTFRLLMDHLKAQGANEERLSPLLGDHPLRPWAQDWTQMLQQEGVSADHALTCMGKVNPVIIPRNHHLETALKQAEDCQDFSDYRCLLEAVRQPYAESQSLLKWRQPPREEEKVRATFCGT